jgi:hypothetical protein
MPTTRGTDTVQLDDRALVSLPRSGDVDRVARRLASEKAPPLTPDSPHDHPRPNKPASLDGSLARRFGLAHGLRDRLNPFRALAYLGGALAAIWLLGALAQGLFLSASRASGKLYLFTWWFEKFALGLIVGLVIGFALAWLVLRRRDDQEAPRQAGGRARRPSGEAFDSLVEKADGELAALKAELAASQRRG